MYCDSLESLRLDRRRPPWYFEYIDSHLRIEAVNDPANSFPNDRHHVNIRAANIDLTDRGGKANRARPVRQRQRLNQNDHEGTVLCLQVEWNEKIIWPILVEEALFEFAIFPNRLRLF